MALATRPPTCPLSFPRPLAVACLLLGAWLATFAAEQPETAPRPFVTCPSTSWPPLVDGLSNEVEWRSAASLGPLGTVGTQTLPAQKTRVRLLRAEDDLFVAFECFENRMADLSTEAQGRDNSRAWGDDCVHLFLAPVSARQEYFHIVVTAANTLFDQRVVSDGQERDPAWNADATSAVSLAEDRWSCELRVSLDALPGWDESGPEWGLNIARSETPNTEWSSWAPMNVSLHEFSNFGTVRWGDQPIVTGLEMSAPYVGRNEFRVSFGAADPGYVSELQVIRGSRPHTKTSVPVSASSGASMSYLVADEGKAAVRLLVRSADSDEVVYASSPIRFHVPPVRQTAQEAVADLQAASAKVREMPEGDPRREILRQTRQAEREAEKIIAEADALMGSGRVDSGAWVALFKRAQELAVKLRIATHKSLLASKGLTDLPPFALGTESSLRKLPPDDALYSPSPTLHLRAARRERESGQIVVASLGEPVEGLRVTWEDLVSPTGATIPRACLDVRLAGYVTTRPPVYEVSRIGRWPDPLLPITEFAVPAEEIQPLWVTVSVPADAGPGRYVGTVVVSQGERYAQEVRLDLEVWDLELPLHGKLKTGFGNAYYGDVATWYGFEGKPPEEFRHRLYEVLLSNRVNPAGLYVPEVWPLLEDFDWCYERGLNALCLGSLEGAGDARIDQIAEAVAWLSERGKLDMAYVYEDVLSPAELAGTQETLTRVKHLFPGLRRAVPLAPARRLWSLVNIWGTLTSDFDYLTAHRRRGVGEQTWWYVCCGPRHPYGNFFIDYPATDARSLFWGAYRHRVEGFFYYEVAMWASNMVSIDARIPTLVVHEDETVLERLRKGERWPDVPWNTFTFSRYNGDGQLIYPGPDQTLIPSLRLEVIRDGIEDYELLALLDGLAERLRALDREQAYTFLVDEARALTSISDSVFTDLAHFTDDPQPILTERLRVARQAQRLSRVVRELEAASATP